MPNADSRKAGTAKFSALMMRLDGWFVAPGPGNDPIRNLQAIPTGKNFFSFNPRRVPFPESDKVATRLAEELVARHKAEHGAVPRKVALQLWGVETLRHQGMQEAQGRALLGVRPVRDSRGRIKDLALIPREELGRPRVDVVFHATSLYRDTFPMLVEMLDQAVRLAASAPEDDNPIRVHAVVLEKQLIKAGYSTEEASGAVWFENLRDDSCER